MNILQISTCYLPHYGGIEQVACDLSRILVKQGHRTKVICFNDNPQTVVDSYEGQEVIRIGYRRKLASQAISLRYFFEMRKVIKDFRPDVIHIHLPNPFVAAFLLLANPECRITLHWHSDIIRQKLLRRLYAPFESALLRNAVKIAATTLGDDDVSNLALLRNAVKIAATTQIYAENSERLKHYLDKVSVIPCIIADVFLDTMTDKDRHEVARIKERYDGKKIIFSIGVHREYKGLRYLIDAAGYLTDDYEVVIAGSGPLSAALKKQADDLHLRNVHFIGRISDEEKRVYLWASDVYAFPSITKNEAFGIALAEALYCGLPAVTFTIEGSGVNYVNQDGVTGMEVHEFDAEKYAHALMSVSKEKYGENAKQWAKEHFTESAIYEQVKQFFGE